MAMHVGEAGAGHRVSIWRKSRGHLQRIEGQKQKDVVPKWLRAHAQERNITRVIAPPWLPKIVNAGKLNLETVTPTDLEACVKPRLTFDGNVLDLRQLHAVRKSTVKILLGTLTDLLMLKLPFLRMKRYDYGFLVHARDRRDVFRGFPFLKFLPQKWVDWIAKAYPPFRLSEIQGLKDVNGRPITGCLITIAGWDRRMFEADRVGGHHKITDGVRLAKRWGAEIVGLGALLPWASDYGNCFKGVRDIEDVTITTGHAYTVIEISRMVRKIISLHPKKDPLVAIVGAGGSTGSCCAQKIVEDGAKNLLLVDKVEKTKVTSLALLRHNLLSINGAATVETSLNLQDVKKADIIVVVTSAEGTIVKSEHLKPGAIVIDDTQPRNIDPKMAKERTDIVILTVLSYIKRIVPNFRFDRHVPFSDFVFTCLADAALRAVTNTRENTVGPASMEGVRIIERMLAELEGWDGGSFEELYLLSYDRRGVSEEEIGRIARLSNP
ncbi:MAG: hypothetical protein HQ596_04605 [Candidatus Saganbacteria bacterium]|nr:hypothetical protein [Candidatus Saganbacteria bacterium]